MVGLIIFFYYLVGSLDFCLKLLFIRRIGLGILFKIIKVIIEELKIKYCVIMIKVRRDSE